jgi:hypothetical protein
MKRFSFLMILFAALFVSFNAFGQDVSQDEMMKAWQEYMTPGDEHAMLANLVGEWEGDITMWMDPSQPPQNTKGTAKYLAIMDGRYIEGTYGAMMMGMPFEGKDISGYDKAKKKYFTFWIDNMGSGMTMARGKYDEKTKFCSMKGTMIDPISGGEVEYRQTMKFIDDNNQHFEMFMIFEGKEVKNMEIVSKRK